MILEDVRRLAGLELNALRLISCGDRAGTSKAKGWFPSPRFLRVRCLRSGPLLHDTHIQRVELLSANLLAVLKSPLIVGRQDRHRDAAGKMGFARKTFDVRQSAAGENRRT